MEYPMEHRELYKKGVDLGCQQQQRQRELLREQKERRQKEQDGNRLLPFKLMHEGSPEAGKPQQQRNKHRQERYNHEITLQQSEWLRERPDNLFDWLLVPCPIGQRCWVMACNGRTTVYNKSGRQIMRFHSLLAGDAYVQDFKTVLDCIYVPDLDKFYILDALIFAQQCLFECEANFRFYWLRERFDEHGDLTQRTRQNQKPFHLLSYYDFEDGPSLTAALQRYPFWPQNKPKLDGLLFYHKEASYTCGTTPLVLWLFAFMLPNTLNLSVHPNYVAPNDYNPSAVLEYMDKFDKKLEAKKRAQMQKSKTVTKNGEEEPLGPSSMDEDINDEDDDENNLKMLLGHERALEMGEHQDSE